MKYLVWLSRILVGALFIVSGLIKLNDPLGFSFKLEEYFSTGVLNLPSLMPYALAISLFVVILEVLLGIFLLLGFRTKFTAWSLLLMILFFTFLTFYSAYFNKVTDCGCFGDAVKLTPWQSFYKDVVLLILILILFFRQKDIQPLFKDKVQWVLVFASLFFCILFGNYVLNHLPLIDFRPYKIGANIREGMQVPEDAPQPIYDYAWKFEVKGEEKVIVTRGDYPEVEGEFLGVETTEIQKGYEPPIHDFTIEKQGEDHTATLLAEDKLLMVIAYDLDKTNYEAMGALAKLSKQAGEKGYKVIGMSASSEEKSRQLSEEYNLGFDFYFTDETTLKTIVRSNPGLLVLKNGTILEKVHYRDMEKLNLP